MFEATLFFTSSPLPYHADEDLWRGPPSEDPSRINAWAGVGSTTRVRSGEGAAMSPTRRARHAGGLLSTADVQRTSATVSRSRPARHREEGRPPHLPIDSRDRDAPTTSRRRPRPPNIHRRRRGNRGQAGNGAGAAIEGWLGGGCHRPRRPSPTRGWFVVCVCEGGQMYTQHNHSYMILF